MKPKFFIGLLTTIALLILGAGCLSSCSTSKDVFKSEQSKDSTVERELRDSLHLLKKERDTFKQQLDEAQYMTAEFDKTKCPDIKPPKCPDFAIPDSVTRYVNELKDALAGMNNKVKRYADGSIEYQGRISKLTASSFKNQMLLVEKDIEIDSLRRVTQKEKIVYVDRVVTKEVHKKSSFLSQWWLFPAGMLFMLLIIYRKRIFSLFKIGTMKNLIVFALCSMFLISCGGAGQKPDDYITFGQAWNHVSESGAYWVWVGISGALLLGYILGVAFGKIEELKLPLLGLLIGFLAFCLFMRPCEVAANTTVEQAARGVFIGY
jgi:hypothetical protein